MTLWFDKPTRRKLKAAVKELKKTDPKASASSIVRQLVKDKYK